ncbi:MAG: hypothetical protein M0002_15120 [Rhodospirillales bacterium]|nr:hypothetical protein [Rhodospirillales bacterium]
MAVLTDGQEWGFYLPTAAGSYEDRRLYRLDLLARETEDACKVLERYLSHSRVKSGQSLKDAQQDHQDAKLRAKALETLPRAWKTLVQPADDLLTDLLAEKTEELCGSRPAQEDIETFLSSLRAEQQPRPPLGSSMPPLQPPARRLRVSKAGHAVEILLDGKREQVPNAIEGLARIIEHLARRDQTFLPRLATRAKGTKRHYVAHRREDVYPHRPDLQDQTQQIQGWYIATNLSNPIKQNIVAWACEVAGLRRGKDIDLIVRE